MSEPKKHHIVPRCYLEKFAVRNRGDQHYVDVLFKKKNSTEIHEKEISTICSINQFYTFDGLPESEKRWLEKYYSHHIENLYHDIYKNLTDPTVSIIAPEFKMKILVYIIFQELRTTKIPNALNSLMNGVLEYAFLAHEQLGTKKKIVSENGEVIDLEGKTLEQAIRESNNSNRQAANLESVKRLKQITELKSGYHIMIVQYKGDLGLISSDRPVHISEPLYSPNCIIRLPIDRNHIVCLYPYNSEVELDPYRILRVEHSGQASMLLALSMNILQIEQSESFIYGRKANIQETMKQHNRLLSKAK